jgi:hypothetical protein
MPNLVHTQLRDGVAVVTIDNPPVNARSPGVWAAVDDAVGKAAADPAAQGDHWQPAPLLARLAAEGRGFHDLPNSEVPSQTGPTGQPT